jgi:hypothetical protein
MPTLLTAVALLMIGWAAPALALQEARASVSFENTEVTEALAKLETLFGTKVVSDGVSGKVTASITQGTAAEALTAVATPLGYKWQKVVILEPQGQQATSQAISDLVRKLDSIGFEAAQVLDPDSERVTSFLKQSTGSSQAKQDADVKGTTTLLEGQKAPDGRVYTAVYYVYDPKHKAAPKMKPQPDKPQPEAAFRPENLGTWLAGAGIPDKAQTFLEVLRGTLLSGMPEDEIEQMMMTMGTQMAPEERDYMVHFMRETLRRIRDMTDH